MHSNHDSVTAPFLEGILSKSCAAGLGSVPVKIARAVTFPFDILSLNGW